MFVTGSGRVIWHCQLSYMFISLQTRMDQNWEDKLDQGDLLVKVDLIWKVLPSVRVISVTSLTCKSFSPSSR